MDTTTFLLNLVICFLLSFLIGTERQYRRRIVGLRTTILVCVGSFLFVSTSFIVGSNRTDLTRIAAQVVSGIGFLGAGVIIKDGLKVRGLTTAATMWCDASIGVLCAVGATTPAIFGTVIILFSNTVLRYINKIINEITNKRHTSQQYLIKVSSSNKNILNIKKYFDEYFDKNILSDISIDDVKLNVTGKKGSIKILLTITKNHTISLDRMIEEVNRLYPIEEIDYKLIKEIPKDDEEEVQCEK